VEKPEYSRQFVKAPLVRLHTRSLSLPKPLSDTKAVAPAAGKKHGTTPECRCTP